MQEIYTMILNTGVTTVIAIIFLWQYVSDIKDKKNNPDYLKEIRDYLKELVDYLKK